MILQNKRDRESWYREKTIESLKSNTYLLENDIILVAETNCFYKVIKTTTDIHLQNNLFAEVMTSNVVGNSTSADKLKTPRIISLTGDVSGSTSFDGSINVSIDSTIANDSHTHSNNTITSLDASKITSGTIDIARLPAGAMERCIVVSNDVERFKLTSSQVQQGDTVKVTATNKMYFVTDTSKLNTEDGYVVYTAGSATEVPWSGVTGKPNDYPPSSHTHTQEQITDFPTSLKNPTAITIQANGTSLGSYDGSSAKTFNITASNVGASASNHTHTAGAVGAYTKEEVDSKLSGKANSSHGNHVPATQSADNKVYLRNDNTWHTITPSDIGAQVEGNYANSNHLHTPEEIGTYSKQELDNKLNGKSDNHEHPYLSTNGGIVNGEITATNFKTTENFNVIDHENRINTLEEKTNFTFLSKDSDLDFVTGEEFYDRDEFKGLAKDTDCFGIDELNKINNSIDTKTPISNRFSTDLATSLLKLPLENKNVLYQNELYLINGEIKKLRNVSNIREIYASNHCSYILTYDNELYSFGYGVHGQLGDGSTTTDNKVHKVQIPKKPIKQISAENSRNVMVLYEDNEIWVFGKNADGSLGLGHTEIVYTPEKIDINFDSPIKQIISKEYDDDNSTSAILLENGELYVCGYNAYYEFGLEHKTNSTTFVKCTFVFDSKIKKIDIHTVYALVNIIVLTENGSIYSSGYGAYGVGFNGTENADVLETPGFRKATILPKDEKIIDFLCGHQGLFIFKTKDNDYFYGSNFNGALGLGDTENRYTELVKNPYFKNKRIKYFNGGNHYSRGCYSCSVFLTEDNECYMSGYNLYYMNGGETGHLNYPVKINIYNKKVKQVKYSLRHRMFLTDDGEIYVTGSNADKQLLDLPSEKGSLLKLHLSFDTKDFSFDKNYIYTTVLKEERFISLKEVENINYEDIITTSVG